MPDQVIETTLAVIAQYTEAPADAISLDASFEDLALDSLDGVSIIADLEYQLNVIIPNEEALEISTVREAVESLRRHMPEAVAQNNHADDGGS